MTETEFFSEQKLKAGNPSMPYGLSRLGTGLIYFLTGFAALSGSLGMIRSLASQGGAAFSESLDGIVNVAHFAVGIILIFASIVMLNRGVGAISRLIVPPRAPRDLQPGDVKTSLKRRELSAYAVDRGETYWLLRRWFPNQFPLMTQRRRQIVTSGLREVTRVATAVLVVAVSLFGAESLKSNPELTVAAGAVPGFPLLFFVLYAAGAVFHVAVAIRMIPSVAPRADITEFRAALRGGGDPSQMAHGLEHELGAIRPPDGTPNRVSQEGFALEEGGVTDSGQFDGSLAVENQPQIVEGVKASQTLSMLACGSGLQVAALLWFLTVPSFERPLGPEADDGVRFVSWLVTLLGGLLLFRMGGRMVDSAASLLSTFRFRSVGVLLEVRGNYARSQVRIGKGIHDSIESENLVVRSDSSVSGYVATLLTESEGLMGPRYVVATIVDEAGRRVEHLVSQWLQRFEQQGATVAGLDLKDAKLAEIVQANLAVDSRRAGGRALAQLEPGKAAGTDTRDNKQLSEKGSQKTEDPDNGR
jgi:hypothetical protein